MQLKSKGEGDLDFLKFQDYDHFCRETGMSGIKALIFLLNTLGKLKE